MKRAASATFAAGLLAASAAAPALAAAAPGATSAWVALDPAVQARWQVLGDPAHAAQVEIAPRQAGKSQRVFVLTSRSSPSYTIGLNKILAVFGREGLHPRITDLNFEQRPERGRQALAMLQHEHFDLAFALGSEATDFLYKHYRGGSTPVVSAEAKDPVLLGQMKDYTTGSGTNFAFTSLNAPIALQMTYVKRLVPGLANVAVLYDSGNHSAVQTQVNPLLAACKQEGVSGLGVAAQTSDVVGQMNAAMPRAIATMRQTDPKLAHSIFWIVGSTAIFTQIHAINALAGGVPVLSAVPDVVSAGEDSAVVAIGTTFEDNAYLAALYGARILQGSARAGDLTVGVVSPPDLAINFLKAREAHLPIPFEFFEAATRVVDGQGRLVRDNGQAVNPARSSPPNPARSHP